jgi:Fur family peroxide stress response transcriptional regulator
MRLAIPSRQDIRTKIVTAGLKATQQRIIILEMLLMHHHTHPTAEEVFQQITGTNPGISLGTVYKTLDSFVEVNLIKRVLSDNNRRFDVNEQPHGHIYCTNTKEIIDYADPELDKLVADYFKGKNCQNFSIQQVSVQIIGAKTDPNQKVSIT